jgi:hypothetical protein
MTHEYLYFAAALLIIIILKVRDFVPVTRGRIYERQYLAVFSWYKLESSQTRVFV